MHSLFEVKFTRRVVRAAGFLGAPFNSYLSRHYRDAEICNVPFPLGLTAPANPGERLVFLSDIHAGPTISWDYLENIAERVTALEPHAILLGGDYLTTEGRPFGRLARLLGSIPAAGGKYAVLGNHDYDFDISRMTSIFGRVGIRVLVNEGTRLSFGDTSLWLAGVDDYRRGMPDILPAIEGRLPGEKTLLLSHNPDFVDLIPPDFIDLMLSGHTHGGQIRPFGLPFVSNSEFGMKYLNGLVTDGPCPVYVSRGIGTVQVALRWGAPAEITVIDL